MVICRKKEGQLLPLYLLVIENIALRTVKVKSFALCVSLLKDAFDVYSRPLRYVMAKFCLAQSKMNAKRSHFCNQREGTVHHFDKNDSCAVPHLKYDDFSFYTDAD